MNPWLRGPRGQDRGHLHARGRGLRGARRPTYLIELRGCPAAPEASGPETPGLGEPPPRHHRLRRARPRASKSRTRTRTRSSTPPKTRGWRRRPFTAPAARPSPRARCGTRAAPHRRHSDRIYGRKQKERARTPLLARAYIKNPNWLRRGEELLQLVIQDDPQNAEAHFALGRPLKDTGMSSRAVTLFKKAWAAARSTSRPRPSSPRFREERPSAGGTSSGGFTRPDRIVASTHPSGRKRCRRS